jgi:hypothetical protein
MLNLKNNLVARLVVLVLSGSVAASLAAASLSRSGSEYSILPALPLDQVMPHLSLNATGGYLISQDATVDGNGWGIRGRRIYSDLSASRWTFPVNTITPGDQQNAKVAVLAKGGAAFAWQSSTGTGNRIYVRFMTPSVTFTSPEIPASARAEGHQSDVAIAGLKDGSVVVVWAEWGRDGSMQGIFGQRFSETGARLGGTFQVNTVTYLNQRTPAVAPLDHGGFVVAWVSDEFRQRGSEYIDIAARIFDAQGSALGNDFGLNSTQDLCANPALTGIPGGFRAAWSAHNNPAPTLLRKETQGTKVVNGVTIVDEVSVVAPVGPPPIESWDVTTRSFDLQGTATAPEVVVNTTRKGDQYAPRLVHLRNSQFVLWTSFGQDRSDEGIYGRVVSGAGNFEGNEFLVNTRTKMKQLYPTASTSGDKLVVAWTSFISVAAGFDVVAQQFTLSADATLPKPAAPFASSLGQNAISVTWAEVNSAEVDVYRVHVDDETAPVECTGGMINLTRPGWTAGSSHSVKLSYRLKDGRVSPLSDAVSVTTWGADENADQLPDNWQRENWGRPENWPSANADTDGDGASNLAEFLAGTDPLDAASALKVQISPREQGIYLEWGTAPGSYYQLQVTTDFQTWTNEGIARFAPSTSDAVPAVGNGQTQYYRVIRMR